MSVKEARRAGNGGRGCGAIAVTHRPTCLLQRPEEWGTEVVAVGLSPGGRGSTPSPGLCLASGPRQH